MFVSEKLLHRNGSCPETCFFKSRNKHPFLPMKASSSFKIPCTDERCSSELQLLMQHPELGWISAITQSLSAFELVHPSSISVALLLQ